MSQTVLAQGVVEFVAQGVEKVAAAESQAIKGLESFAAKADGLATVSFSAADFSAFTSAIQSATAHLENLAASAKASVSVPVQSFYDRVGAAISGAAKKASGMIAPLVVIQSLSRRTGTAILGVFRGVSESIGSFAANSAKTVRDFSGSIVSGLGRAAGTVATFGALVSGAVTAFAVAGMRGTVEGERLTQAFTLLSRVISDQLAPFVRIMTANVLQLSILLSRIDPVTRNWVTGLVLATGAAAGFVAILAKMAGPLGTVLTLVGALIAPLFKLGIAFAAALGPVGLIVGGIAAVGAAIALAIVPTNEWGKAWDMLMVGISIAWNNVGKPAIDGIGQAIADTWAIVGPTLTLMTQAVLDFFGNGAAGGVTFGGVMATVWQALADVWAVVSVLSEAIGEGLTTAFQALWEVARPVIEGIQALWRWLTENIRFTWQDVVQFVADVFLGAGLVVASVINGIYRGFMGMAGGIIELLAAIGKSFWVLSGEAAAAMAQLGKDMAKSKLIDEEALAERFGGLSNKIADKLKGNAQAAQDLAKQIDAGVAKGANKAAVLAIKAADQIKDALPELKIPDFKMPKLDGAKAFGTPGDLRGNTIKGEVGFESFGSTWERLQKGFASNPLLDVNKMLLSESQKQTQLQMAMAQGAGRPLVPAVGA